MKGKESQVFLESKILPVILSGGSGSRLWPLSRSSFPKQYLSLEERNNHTLLQNSFLRLKNIKNLDNPLIICNEEQRFIVAEQMRAINVSPKLILLEPFGRSTCPAIALSSLISKNQNIEDDPLMLVLSADHHVEKTDNFIKSINKGIKHASEGRIVVFGVTPTSAETGYGYIESFDEISKEVSSSRVKRFIEKPNKESAEKFIKDKHFSWNSGIFMFKASTILNELQKYDKKVLNICKKAIDKGTKDFDFLRIDKEIFKKCPNCSIDISVMEKTVLASVIKFDCGWNDLGSWKTLWEISESDQNGNHLKGKTFIKDVKNTYLKSESRLVAGLGLRDLFVVETEDAVLVAHKNSINSLKDLVNSLSKANFKESKTARKVHRPWGNYKTINEGKSWQVKQLEINPYASISLQLHNHRSEHWIVVNGIAKVEINDSITHLRKNQSIYVPLGAKHRLSNPNKSKLTLIEVQSGEYLGEDDIVRFDDIYGRVKGCK